MIERATVCISKIEIVTGRMPLHSKCFPFIIQEAIATSEEVGRDLEHVEVLQKKFDDFLKDIQANESRVTYINELAHQLGDEGHPDIELISTKQAVRTQIFVDLGVSRKNKFELGTCI